jgi:HK97 family phage prohead protease
MEFESRSFVGGVRAHVGPNGPQLVGYAAVFGRPSHDLGGFIEIIEPGAFTRTLRESPDVFALIDHNTSLVLGRTKSGTLKLTEDAHGLRAEITPPDTIYARDLLASVGRGDVAGMSFRFFNPRAEFRNEGGRVVRRMFEVGLREVSVLPIPAYPDTSVALRSLHEWRQRGCRAPGPEYFEFYRRRLRRAAS